MNKPTILITGCSSGFGKLTARKFHMEGWNVIATMRSPQKEQELTQLAHVRVTKLDVTQKETIYSSINEGVEAFGKIDAWVNNAGYGGHAMLEQFSEEQIYAMFETNVFGVMRCCQAILPVFRKQKHGTIVNVTSMAGYIGLPLSSVYSSSKYAVEGLTEALAHEYKPFGIRVMAVAPGAFDTQFSKNTDNTLDLGDEEAKTFAHKVRNHFIGLALQMKQQGGRAADPQEVADIIFDCVTKESPVHMVVGSDAEMLLQMKDSMTQQEFLTRMEAMMMPPNS